ncbi:hypothetical protein ACXHPE_04020 [Vibrio cincinnatiensis]
MPKFPVKKSTMVTAGIAFAVVIVTMWLLNNSAAAKTAAQKVGVSA